jgi:hypothetical protein
MIVCIPLGFWYGGFPGAIVALGATETLRYLVGATGVRKHGIRVLLSDLRLTAAVATASGAVYWLSRALQNHGAPALLIFAATVGATCLLWAPVGIWYVKARWGKAQAFDKPAAQAAAGVP